MKIGVRKPSPKRAIRARTTGAVKRQVKASIDPTYGKNGSGVVKDPKKSAYNKIYKQATVSAFDFNERQKEIEQEEELERLYLIKQAKRQKIEILVGILMIFFSFALIAIFTFNSLFSVFTFFLCLLLNVAGLITTIIGFSR